MHPHRTWVGWVWTMAVLDGERCRGGGGGEESVDVGEMKQD